MAENQKLDHSSTKTHTFNCDLYASLSVLTVKAVQDYWKAMDENVCRLSVESRSGMDKGFSILES